jgi:hypothetical protein
MTKSVAEWQICCEMITFRHDVRDFIANFGNNEETSESVRQKFYEIL